MKIFVQVFLELLGQILTSGFTELTGMNFKNMYFTTLFPEEA